MIRTIALGSISLALAAAALLADPPASASAKPKDATDASPADDATSSSEKEGVRLNIRMPKSLTAGSPLPVQIKLANGGKTPVWVGWETQNPLKVRIELSTQDGKRVPFTRYGRKTFQPTDLRDQLKNLKGSIRQSQVKPEEETKVLSVPNLALYYDLTVPGEYVLTVTESVSVGEDPSAKSVKLTAGPIRFTINNP